MKQNRQKSIMEVIYVHTQMYSHMGDGITCNGDEFFAALSVPAPFVESGAEVTAADKEFATRL
jgi:hypothetical protein